MRYVTMSIFFIMIIAQWYIPISMITSQESILADGDIYKFKTRPIDPTDPFRGKYITLDFEANTFQADTAFRWEYNDELFVTLAKDALGYAFIKAVSKTRPENGVYVKAKAGYGIEHETVTIHYPFERFYLEESKASEAERLYWEANSDSTQATYAVVRIKDGNAALQDVMINGESIISIIKNLEGESVKN